MVLSGLVGQSRRHPEEHNPSATVLYQKKVRPIPLRPCLAGRYPGEGIGLFE